MVLPVPLLLAFTYTLLLKLLSREMFYFRIARSPSTAKVRSKMLYASSNQKFKSGLNGIQVELQATDASEISLDEIKDRAR